MDGQWNGVSTFILARSLLVNLYTSVHICGVGEVHHLPLEYWEGNMLEVLTKHIGPLLKVDEQTLFLSKACYALVWLGINLSQPLERGF